jgi:uncharacterized repeat protein (TIGR01451 family)
MVHTRFRTAFRYVLILQVLLWLLAPGTAWAASASPAAPEVLQPIALEEPTPTDLEPGPALSLSAGEALQIGTGVQPQATPTTSLTVSILSSRLALWNSVGPQTPTEVVVIHAMVTNSGEEVAVSPELELDYNENPAGGWTLLEGEYPQRDAPGDLAPGQSFHGYWFARYPNAASSHQYTVTARAGNAAPVSTSDNFYGNPAAGKTIATEDSRQTGNTAQVEASTEVVVGVAFTISLSYELSQSPEELIFSPVGNTDFDASAYRLLAAHVQLSNDEGTWSEGYSDQLYFPNPPSQADKAQVTYTFVAVKLADATLCPYTGVRDSTQLKYDNNYCTPGSQSYIEITGSLSFDMEKQVDHTTLQQGQLLAYTIDIDNVGEYTLQYAWLWDQVDSALGAVVDHSPGIDVGESNLAQGLIVWSLPTIPPYASDTYTVTFLVDGDGADIPDGTAVVNTAHFGINPGDLPPEPALTSAATSALEAPWIELSKSDGRTQVNPGDALTYALHVANTGSVAATNLVITDVLPEGVSYASGSASIAEGSRTNQMLVWTSLSLGPGEEVTIEIPVTVDPQAEDGDVLLNSAEAQYENNLGWTFSRSAEDSTTVIAEGFIDGYAFIDTNGNGIRDLGEAGLPGVDVTLDGPVAGTQVETTGTPDGDYRFRLTAQQPVTVSAALLPGYFRTTPGTVYHNASLWVTQTINFGYAPTTSEFGTVYGTVYEDADHDGAYGPGEAGLSEVEMWSNGAETTPVSTNELGQYTLRYDTAGLKTVNEINPPTYVSTTPDEVEAAVSLHSGLQVDFGDYAGIKIAGQVFEDLNVNGINDDGSGIAGVEVTIGDQTLATEADGTYTTYITLSNSDPIPITETDPSGYRSTNAIGSPSGAVTRLDANQLRIESPTAGTVYRGDFGDVQAQDVVTITGRVWNDTNADGVYDNSGLGGAVVGISGGMTQTTAADGWFTLYALPGSEIMLAETNPDGYVSTNAIPGDSATKIDNDTLELNLAVAGTTSSGNRFGDAPAGETALISGVVFDDADENGALGASESGLPGVTVTLETVGGQSIAVQTNASGAYQFAVAPGQDVRITSSGPGGAYAPTTPESVIAHPPAAGTYPNVNFGYSDDADRPSLIYGLVYDDLNGDGAHELGEPGLTGAVVSLDGTTPVTTSGNGLITGTYAFRVDTPGAHVVTEADPSGYHSTTPNTAHVTVGDPTGDLYRVNFGDSDDTDTASVHGTVFDDQNVNAAWDAEEPGLAGVTVTLSGSAAGLPKAAVTNEWGQYTFLVAETGTFTVTETDLTGYVSTNAIAGDAATRIDDNTLRVEVSALGESLGGNLFGDVLLSGVVTISGTVWDDNGAGGGTANDGVRDAGEAGLAGATVSLSSGMVATTGESGSFTLYAPPMTAVTVIETNPDGYLSSGAIAGSNATRVDDDTLTVSTLSAGQTSSGNLFGDVLPADLAVSKSAAPDPAVAGALVTYTIGYSNNGPSYAQNVQIIDTLPPGVSYEGVVNLPAGWAEPVYDDGAHTLTWTASELAAGATGTIGFAVRPAPDASGTLVNAVTIDSSMPDPATADNAAQAVTPLTAEADLTVSKTSVNSVVAGTALTYTLVVQNAGPSYAQDVLLTDVLPAGVSVVDTSVAPTAQDEQTLSWDLGTLSNGVSRTITIAVLVDSDAAGWITNTAQVASSTSDPQMPNVAERRVYVGTVADLQIVKSAEPTDTVIAGTQLTYTLQVHNDGTSSAQDVVVTDTLPVGVQLVEATGSYVQDGQQVVWQLGTLADGATETIVVLTEVSSGVLGTITNTAEVGSSTMDPFDSNSAQISTQVIAEADLSILKSATPDPVEGQGTLTYRLDYGNDGPSDAQQVCIVDTLPEAVRWDEVSSEPAGWSAPTYDAGAHTLTWCRNTVAAGDSGTITFEVTVLPGIGTLSNSVIIGSETPDPNMANNAPAPTQTAIGCGADAYEEDDTYAEATTILNGTPQAHNFSDDSSDWLRFTAQRGFKYTITTSSWGERADTFLSLYGTDGSTLLEGNDDLEGTEDYSSQIVWEAPADGTYYVQVANRAGLSGCYTEYDVELQQEGRYFLYLPVVLRDHTASAEAAIAPEAQAAPEDQAEPEVQVVPEMQVEVPDEPNTAPDGESDVGIAGVISHDCPDAYEQDDTWETASPIVSGVGQLHSFDSDIAYYAADKDFVSFDLRAGQQMAFTVTPANGELPVLLELYDAAGTALGISNAEGESQLTWQASQDGNYYLSVTAWPGSEVFGCDDAAEYMLLAEAQPWWSLYLPIVLRGH